MAAATLPSQLLYPNNFVYCIVNIKQFMAFIYLFFYACLRLQFLDVKTNPGPFRPVPAVYRILCSNVLGLAGNLCDLTVATSRYDILLCSETLVSVMRHVSELLVPGFGRPVLCGGRMPRTRGMAAYVRRTWWIWSISPIQVWVWLLQNVGFWICGVRQNLYLFSLYHNPDLDDHIFECLL